MHQTATLRPVSATPQAPGLAQDDPLEVLRGRILRAFYLTCLVCSLVGVLLFASATAPVLNPARWAAMAGYLVVAATAAVAMRLTYAAAVRVVPAFLILLLAVIGDASVVSGRGVSAPAMVFLGLISCMACAVSSPRNGVLVAAVTMALPASLGLAESAGLIAASQAAPLSIRVSVLLLAVLAGAAAGLALARLLAAHVGESLAREARFQALLGIAADGYWEAGPDLQLRGVSMRDAQGQFQSISGPRRGEIWQTEGVQIDPESVAVLRRTLACREPLRDLPARWRLPDGRWTHVLASGQPRYDLDRHFLGYWGVARDVTRQHEADAALLRSQELLAALVSASPDVMTLTDLDTGCYVMVNAAFCSFSGWSASEVVGRTSTEINIWADMAERGRLLTILSQVDSVADLSLRFRTKRGEIRPLMVLASRFTQEGKSYLVVNARDSSESQRVQLEREAILDNASVGIAFARRGVFEMTNRHFDAIYGWPAGELVGRSTQVVWPDHATAQAYRNEVAPVLRRGEAVQSERWTVRHDGAPFLVSLRAKAIDPLNPSESGTIWIAEDVTAQNQAQADLARARDEAEAANRAKSDFLANTSHEIRTPLNALQGLARLARQPGLDQTKRGQYLDQIADSAQTLGLIISDILDLSKIEAGKLDIETATFDLRELLDSVSQAYSALATARGLGFEIELDPRLATDVRGDALRVRQVLSNFLHNALKFTERGAIGLRVLCLDGDRVRFEVHDTGPGIDAQTRERLFTPFTQADGSTTRRFGGTGLGLAICRQLATLMGGVVGLVSSSAEDTTGSCFYAELTLPEASQTEVESIRGPLDHDPLQGVRVLLVEDNAVNMMIAVALLESWGMQVGQACDGHLALAEVARAEAAAQPYQLVLMDLQMPGISGIEATQRLRQRYTAAQLPVVALTAAALVSERERALAVGMNDFLTKPLDTRRMRSVLTRVLGGG